MSAEELKRLRLQNEANAVEIQRLKMRSHAPQQHTQHQPPPQQHFQPQQEVEYAEVDPEEIAVRAANIAADRVQKHMQNYGEVEQTVKKRMNRLVEQFPALQDESSRLVQKAREEYQRIAVENPTLDEATRYELSVQSAASMIGARPVNAPVDLSNEDFVMPSQNNPAISRGSKRGGKSRLTSNILANAKIMGINIDPNTPEGKRNLEELEESTVRFNADADETMYKYR